MAAYELSKEWIKANGELIKEAYSSAEARDYDVSSKADVLKILHIVDPQNATEENAEVFSKILQLFALSAKKAIKGRYTTTEKTKEKIVH